MGADKNPRRVADNEAMAVARMLRTSPQKLNLVAGLIRGKKVDRALTDLTFSKRRIAAEVKKVLQSPSRTPRTITTWTSTLWSSPRPGWQEPGDEAGPSAGPWPVRQDHEAVL